ncbi:4-alpha-glucanotransferase [Kocuria sp.]|uniref:4-alpha-glucanotransferase n=1 Tax=Kocuria sp. TaxID=1871328 RepID=UPI0026E0ECFC|nr:4-alpha-glucanotransferase [Kocuria sp.]MDO5618638.1 4-alpha-glucanotransferase [Kocuria sp.]
MQSSASASPTPSDPQSTGSASTQDGVGAGQVSGDSLTELAAAYGVRTRYDGFDGGEVTVPQATLEAVLSALGADLTDEDTAQASLAAKQDESWQGVLPPVVVTTEGEPTTVALHIPVQESEPDAAMTEPDEAMPQPTVEILVGDQVVALSHSDTPAETRQVNGAAVHRVFLDLPTDLAPEWYTLRAVVDGDQYSTEVAVTPARLRTTDRLEGRRRWGWAVQLYSVASNRSWGVGDINDLAALAAIGGQQGADYILVNPLHASEPVPPIEPSPYLPTTRRFFNPLYLRVADVREYAYLRPSDLEVVSTLAALERRKVLDADHIDRDGIYAAKLKSLELLYTVRRSPQRQQQLEKFVRDGGTHLQDFALWCALREELGVEHELWATEAATPDGPYAAEARERLKDRVNFFVWLQWLLDNQLGAAQRAAQSAGMEIGVMHDLAVGVTKDGADAWTLHDVLAHGVSVGAPADMYNQQGQNWSQPPWHPQKLAQAGYKPWREMLRTIFRHAGGIRVDHVIGLFRLWWIPEGNKASDGAYVYYDHEAMVGILALEAQRAGVVVVGEDLGTVEPSAREFLSERGVLGTSVLWFEQEDGAPKDPSTYRVEAFASVGTHDLPPTAGFLEGIQVDLRADLGVLERPVEVERAEAQRQVSMYLEAAAESGDLPSGRPLEELSDQEKIEGLYRYLAQAPSLLHCVQLVDAVGEKRVQNQPGTSDEYPNWQIPLADDSGKVVLVEALQRSARVASLAQVMNQALGSTDRSHRGAQAPEQPLTVDSEAPAKPWHTATHESQS